MSSNERFVRWQNNAVAQLSSALSLLSGLSIAGLAFMFSLLRDPDFRPNDVQAVCYLVALGGFFVAGAAGMGAVVTRLLDFRLTAQKIRASDLIEPVTMFGADASTYGKATWRLFWTLISAFAVAVVAATVTLTSVFLSSMLARVTG